MPRQRLRWTRTRGQRAFLTVNVVVVVVLTVAAATLGYAAQKLGAIDRVDVAASLTATVESEGFSASDITILTPEAAAQSAATTTTEPSVPPGPAENYLIVGSDNAENIASDDPLRNGRDDEITNNLADTIMVLRLEPATGQAILLSVPRDLEVTVAGTDSQLKINAAFNFEEPREARVGRLIDTVEESLGIGIQHYVEVDLAAFRRVVDSVGGVQVCFDGPTRDERTGLFIPEGGWHLLDGPTALQYVRGRTGLQTQDVNGRWRGQSSRGDLDRIGRQQDFVREAVDQVFADVISDPGVFFSVLDILADELTVSNSFNIVGDGRNLASWFRDLDDENLTTLTLDGYLVDLPETAARTDSRLGLRGDYEAILDIFRGIGLEDVVPKRVEVSIRADDRDDVVVGLEALGFEIATQWVGAGEIDGVVIHYGLGGHQAANLVAAYLDYAVEFVQDGVLFGNEVVLEYGADVPVVLLAPRALTIAAVEIVLPQVPTTSIGPATPTTTTPSLYEFDCDVPRPE